MPTVIPFDDIRLSPSAALFEGKDEAAVSIFITRHPHGRGPDLHHHPYAEVFVVEEGTATFTVGDEQIEVAGGHVVVVPPETVHGFKNRGEEELRVIGIHPSPEVRQTDVE
jgi:mannose-6-phosphate isomerase-like protein (cupin superfamily)